MGDGWLLRKVKLGINTRQTLPCYLIPIHVGFLHANMEIWLFSSSTFVKLQKEMFKNCSHGNFHVRNVVKICSDVHADTF